MRNNNQDCFSITPVKGKNMVIFCLCDGMGGHAAGEIASHVAERAFVEFVLAKLTSRVNKNPKHGEILINACAEANSLTCRYSELSEDYRGLGTTIVGGILQESGHGNIVNVGDSRAYLYSAETEKITQITNDHSLVEAYISAGLISRDEARKHPQKNIITRALGAESSVEADVFKISMKKGDMLLLCSDGLTNYVTDEELQDLFKATGEPEDYCRELLSLTYKRGAGDNVTIISVVM